METAILFILVLYFCILLLISWFAGKKNSDNQAFFLANRKSPWYVIAFGMIGSSISGVTFVSVPGMVSNSSMTYFQMVCGFLAGYLVIAYILLPLYYRLKLTSIYTFLEQRFGRYSYKTGASFFVLSKTVGAAARLYLVVFILHRLVFSQWGIHFGFVATGIVALILGYTFRSGIKTIVWTDTVQTLSLIAALVFICYQIMQKLDVDFSQVVQTVEQSSYARIFVFDDWHSTENFWKQFFSGVLIAIVMNGLDQDMMQKSLTCKTLRDAQKNMVSFGIFYLPVNLLFLSLGAMLILFAAKYQLVLPTKPDEILPYIAANYLGFPAVVFFSVGIIAAAFSSADSALTALTTTICIDLLDINRKKAATAVKTRHIVHVSVSLVFLATVLIIHNTGQGSILNTIYKIASYTYGPLLGMFFFGLFTKINLKDSFVPLVCIMAPILSFCLEFSLDMFFHYKVGNEILLFNGLITVFGLLAISKH
ncbi:MAG: sodium:solute symporter [Bacteroidales bacterium]|jgi:Na+/proline symporter|nr:sodium:solute symporter [Bacteroidales bacterium]